MGYEPLDYWPARYREQGAVYVARHGMTPKESAKQAAEFCRHIAPSSGNVLDFGCGVGRLVRHLAPPAREYLGMDICGEALEFARKAHGANSVLFEHASSLEMMPDGYFDLTVCCTVLQHVPDSEIDGLMAELKRVTGGRFCIIDSAEFESEAEHMFPREPREYVRWLDLQEPERHPVNADHRGSHYALSGWAKADSLRR